MGASFLILTYPSYLEISALQALLCSCSNWANIGTVAGTTASSKTGSLNVAISTWDRVKVASLLLEEARLASRTSLTNLAT